MIVRGIVVVVLGLVTGLLTIFRGDAANSSRPDERWLEQALPGLIGKVPFIPSQENPLQSYKMDQGTYAALKPFGIVSRVYEKSGERYDAVVIAGDNADSFHDQRACFQSQGWKILSDKEIELDVPGKGRQPAVELTLEGPNGRAIAIYAFRGPSGRLYNRFGEMWKDYFVSELTTGRISGGEFFRFIDLTGTEDPTKLHKFAADFLGLAVDTLDKAKKARG